MEDLKRDAGCITLGEKENKDRYQQIAEKAAQLMRNGRERDGREPGTGSYEVRFIEFELGAFAGGSRWVDFPDDKVDRLAAACTGMVLDVLAKGSELAEKTEQLLVIDRAIGIYDEPINYAFVSTNALRRIVKQMEEMEFSPGMAQHYLSLRQRTLELQLELSAQLNPEPFARLAEIVPFSIYSHQWMDSLIPAVKRELLLIALKKDSWEIPPENHVLQVMQTAAYRFVYDR